jgi:hypothetical protein
MSWVQFFLSGARQIKMDFLLPCSGLICICATTIYLAGGDTEDDEGNE